MIDLYRDRIREHIAESAWHRAKLRACITELANYPSGPTPGWLSRAIVLHRDARRKATSAALEYRAAIRWRAPEPTLSDLHDAGSLHTAECPPVSGDPVILQAFGLPAAGVPPRAPALHLEATPAGMQYSMLPPPATVTKKGQIQGRLF